MNYDNRTTNPLLYSAMRGDYMRLGVAPDTSTVSFGADKMNIVDRPKVYRDYRDISSGQIQYYRTPVYSIFKDRPSIVYQNNFIDPMGVIKPEFVYKPNVIKNQGCYDSFTRDMVGNREDLMSRYFIKLNQNNYNLNKTSCIQKQHE